MQKGASFNLEAVKEQIEKAMQSHAASRMCGERALRIGAPVLRTSQFPVFGY